ncbi:UNVERIFIED_ORG: NADPH:quinone reductase-like Zn-dependent oxidoreductase [Microbispora rosea subsp. rosea]
MSVRNVVRAAAVGFHHYGGPDVLTMVEVDVPPPGTGQLLVRTRATPVNPADVWFWEGGVDRLVGDRPWPRVPGLEVAGTVETCGEGAPFVPGDRILGVTTFIDSGRGCQSEVAVLDAADTALIPPGMGFAEASTLPMSALTALASIDTLDLPPGSTLLIVGVTGAVGAYAAQLARARDLRVLATAREDDQAYAASLGADVCVSRDDVVRGTLRAAPRGVDGVIDTAVLGSSILGAIRPGGRLALMRPMSGAERPEAERAGVDVHLISVRAYQGDPDRLAGLVRQAAAGDLRLRVADTVPPRSAAEAHRRLSAGGTRGRLVLEW